METNMSVLIKKGSLMEKAGTIGLTGVIMKETFQMGSEKEKENGC